MVATKERLYQLIDRLGEKEIEVAECFLEFLDQQGSGPVLRAITNAPIDDEPLTEEELRVLDATRHSDDEVLSHEEAVRDFMKP